MVVIAPHPDDEVIGVGGHFAEARDLWILYVTDGAPRNLADAAHNGFSRREDYATARREEAVAALNLAGIAKDHAIHLGVVDQEASFQLGALARRLCGWLRTLAPETILAPAYEGGHPDHDAVAFAVSAARRILETRGTAAPVLEYTLYHRGEKGLEIGTFLPPSSGHVERIPLGAESRDLKQRMLACFRTQQRVLDAFSLGEECFRTAPEYDFTAPPHEGPLYYEQFPWGVTGPQWRQLAREAAAELGAEHP